LLNMLGGITRFDGYLLDTTNHDVILIGNSAPSLPTLHLDDFAVILQNVWSNDTPPFCSLEPNSKDLMEMRQILNRRNLGNDDDWLDKIEKDLADVRRDWHAQKVIFKGIPQNSHHAQIMLDADYHMKRVTLGLLTVPDVTSYLDRFIAFKRQSVPTDVMNNAPFSAARFWFHIHSFDAKDSSMVPYPHFETSDRIVVLDKCQVVLLTEKQLTGGKGEMIGTNEPDVLANTFAQEFSDQYPKLVSMQTSYAMLEQLFRLNALVRAMRLWNVFDRVGINPGIFLSAYRQQLNLANPDSLPGLVNFIKMEKEVTINDKRYIYVQFPIAYGGVDMDFPVTEQQFMHNHEKELDSLLNKVLALRPNTDTGAWKVPLKKSHERKLLK